MVSDIRLFSPLKMWHQLCFEALNPLVYFWFCSRLAGYLSSNHHYSYDGWQLLLSCSVSFGQRLHLFLSADGDNACQASFPGGSGTDPLTCISIRNMNRWNWRWLINAKQCLGRRPVLIFLLPPPECSSRRAVVFWAASPGVLGSLKNRVSSGLLSLAEIIWGSLAVWQEQIIEMLQGLINNIAVVH